MRWLCVAVPLLTCLAPSPGLMAQDDATVLVSPPQVTPGEEGNRVIQDVTLATALASYTLRYDVIDLDGQPGRVGFAMWAPSIGYTPLGIIAPSGCLWYNQGFFIWTLDDLNIQDYQASFRVVRDYGPDAMVEYVWDTPKAKVIARFAVTSGSDKLIFFGRYEPKEEVKEVKLRLMAYPATFTKPWNRTLTTATRTLTTGATDIDLEKEKWLLLEDVTPDRPASGSAGLLLGDTSAFSKVSVDSIGGYAEYVNLTLSPERREFVLGLYELPSAPEYKATREYFGRLGDSESAALAQVVLADLDRPLPPLPVDAERLAQIEKSEAQLMDRPAEIWRPDPSPLPFPWAAAIPGEPVRVGLLCPRFIAYETMELGRRLEMDLRRLYFDGSGAMTAADYWPYRGTTGIGPLPAGVAMRHAMGICQDPTRDVIMVCKINGDTLGPRLRGAILDAVKGGKGLLLTGGSGMLKGWPAELTATPDDSLLSQTLSALPWQDIAGLRPGEKMFEELLIAGKDLVVLDAAMGEDRWIFPGTHIQAAAVGKIVETRPFVDPNAIGIWGWSGGGSMSLNAIFRYPDLYRMAMAIAFVSDERFYDTIYQERYMGLPDDNAEGYKNGSPITFAHQLRGRLLLVHGTADDNVHYQNCEALVNELVKHDKAFTMMSYPGRTHGIGEGDGTTVHLYSLLTRYLEENLPGARRAPEGGDR